ncbi:hypothetical protein HYH03_003396 [Edaphochlamys debaryana]|uniref:uracil phosphoribosyltransferase n=1 Tax=Edaphochlamys debaryana TaxID=47281 RepID=A0A835YH97_9CHLO|nr:hypothetical protein HYH03_003396 [Edaphochlamys debaryana]|eukprot:KAG2498650.1 hypothetical protein HYH03_003396 [Edaphochlamys debaryana]
MRSLLAQRPAGGVTRRSAASARRVARVSLVVRATADAVPKPKKPQQMLVYAPPHPLIKHWLALLRSEYTPPQMFRSACAELGRLLIYEAVRDFLPTIEQQVQTPLGAVADATLCDPTKPIKVVPILRAGLVLLEQAGQVMPFQETYHVGYVRDPKTLQATAYLNKLPAKVSPDDLFLITDPMLATGGTIVQVIEDIVSRGGKAENIRVVAVVVAPPALKKLADRFPGLKVYTAMIDEQVDERGYIIPGLGDAGDRAYGTPH